MFMLGLLQIVLSESKSDKPRRLNISCSHSHKSSSRALPAHKFGKPSPVNSLLCTKNQFLCFVHPNKAQLITIKNQSLSSHLRRDGGSMIFNRKVVGLNPNRASLDFSQVGEGNHREKPVGFL